MLFLSGLRIGAFVTLPILSVDLDDRIINQFPSLGVRTKSGKHGTTFLLDIPELLAVVKDWDQEIKTILPETGYWFAPLSSETGEIDQEKRVIGENRFSNARRHLKEWLYKVNLTHHCPHKFGHGYIHYGLSRTQNIADFKAISQHAIHSSMEITDQFYSYQNDKELHARICSLGKGSQASNSIENDFKLFTEFLAWKKQSGS